MTYVQMHFGGMAQLERKERFGATGQVYLTLRCFNTG